MDRQKITNRIYKELIIKIAKKVGILMSTPILS